MWKLIKCQNCGTIHGCKKDDYNYCRVCVYDLDCNLKKDLSQHLFALCDNCSGQRSAYGK